MLLFINKIVYAFYILILIVCNSQVTHIPFLRSGFHVSNSIYSFQNFYTKGLRSNIYYTGDYIKSDKIDIFIGNHFNYFDFMPLMSIIKSFDDKEIFFLYSSYVDNVPVIGRGFKYSKNIGLKKTLIEDKEPLINFIKNVKKGIIYIYPEGTRVTTKKLINSKKYSLKNNLDQYDYVLYPKMKGLHLIINELKKHNKLGNLIDVTLKVHKLKMNEIHIKNIFYKDIGNSYCQIKTYEPEPIEDYDKFKKWFLQIWDEKDKFLKNYKTEYKFLKLKQDSNNLVILQNNLIIFVMLNIFYIIYFKKEKFFKYL